MQAVILAGGKGTRLRPYTTIFPKPLMPIDDIPILEIIVRQLASSGISKITFAVGHLKELIEAYFGDGSRWGVEIKYSYEDKPLGTAAPIKLIKNLSDNFIVMNGDILTNLRYDKLIQTHLAKKCICTITTYKKRLKIDLGVLHVDNYQVKEYVEKPIKEYLVSMGVYVFNKQILEFIPSEEYYDFPQLINSLIQKKQPIRTYDFQGLWLDIGRPTDYEEAIGIFSTNRSEFLY